MMNIIHLCRWIPPFSPSSLFRIFQITRSTGQHHPGSHGRQATHLREAVNRGRTSLGCVESFCQNEDARSVSPLLSVRGRSPSVCGGYVGRSLGKIYGLVTSFRVLVFKPAAAAAVSVDVVAVAAVVQLEYSAFCVRLFWNMARRRRGDRERMEYRWISTRPLCGARNCLPERLLANIIHLECVDSSSRTEGG